MVTTITKTIVTTVVPSSIIRHCCWYLVNGLNRSNCKGAYAPRGADNIADSYINLSNPLTYVMKPVGNAPGWNAINGWIFTNGQWLSTSPMPLVPPNTQIWSAVVKYTNAADNDGWVMGLDNASGNRKLGLIPKLLSGGGRYPAFMNGGQAFDDLSSPGTSSCILGFAGNKCYVNGIDFGLNIAAWSGANSYSPYIGGCNYVSISTQPFTGEVQAAAFYDVILTPSQMLELYSNILRANL